MDIHYIRIKTKNKGLHCDVNKVLRIEKYEFHSSKSGFVTIKSKNACTLGSVHEDVSKLDPLLEDIFKHEGIEEILIFVWGDNEDDDDDSSDSSSSDSSDEQRKV